MGTRARGRAAGGFGDCGYFGHFGEGAEFAFLWEAAVAVGRDTPWLIGLGWGGRMTAALGGTLARGRAAGGFGDCGDFGHFGDGAGFAVLWQAAAAVR